MTPQDLAFDSHGITCRGHFYSGQGKGPRPCIIMGHGFGATRACGLAPFAAVFVAAGYSVFGKPPPSARACVSLRCRSGQLMRAYKCYVFVAPDRLAEGWSRDRILQEISARGVPCFSGSCSEVYLEKALMERASAPKHVCPSPANWAKPA